MKLPSPISFDWDKGNLEKNWIKHKISFKEAEETFLNKLLKIYEDIKHSQSEQRFYALGITNNNKLLYITFTIRQGKLRVISARIQSNKERRLYEKEN